MRLPVSVRYPSSTSTMIANMRNEVSPPSSSHSMYLAVPTRPAARPPKACDNAVRCGTAVSGTHDSGTPMIVPITSATTIHV